MATTEATIPGCSKTLQNATFDLSPLNIKSQLQYYSVYGHGTKNYTYHFNICGKVHSTPCTINPSLALGACPTTPTHNGSSYQCSNLQPIADPAVAYQYLNDSNGGRCYHVSGSTPTHSWRLLDSTNPARGVMMVFEGGDFCEFDGVNRQLVLGFKCADDVTNIPDTELAEENPTCVYGLNISSIHGCPVECGRMNNNLCNDVGLCDFDRSAGRPKCFCFHGAQGNACEDDVSASAIPPPTDVPLSTCSWTTNWRGVNVSFDFAPFDIVAQRKQAHAFKVHDANSNVNRHYDYYFNLCSDIPDSLLPGNCSTTAGPCLDMTKPCNGSNTPIAASGIAFQTTINNDCYLLGQSSTVSYSLFDPRDATRGVTVEYGSGSWCAAGGKNRALQINLRCPDSSRQFFDPQKESHINETIGEALTCTYQVTYESAYACPKQCQTFVDGKLTVCSGRGICGADTSVGFVRCLCDDGWDGQFCEKVYVPRATLGPRVLPPEAHTPGGVIALIVILAIFLIGCAAGLYYVYRRAMLAENQMRLIEEKYREGDDEDSGGLVGHHMGDVRMPRDFDDDDDNDQL